MDSLIADHWYHTAAQLPRLRVPLLVQPVLSLICEMSVNTQHILLSHSKLFLANSQVQLVVAVPPTDVL